MAWTTNSIMSWRTPGSGTIVRVTDHGRSALSEDWERIETKTRMTDGTLRRYTVSKKRIWSCSWTNIPSTNNIANGLHTVDGGMSGEDIELWVNTIDVPFRMILRRGSAEPIVTPPNPAEGLLPYQDANFYIANVMIAEYTKEVTKRGKLADLWDISITLEEV